MAIFNPHGASAAATAAAITSLTKPPSANAQGFAGACNAPPGFTWVGQGSDGLYMPFAAVGMPPGSVGLGGPCFSPLAFPGLGMKIGPFVFPWTLDTMPSAPKAGSPQPGAAQTMPGMPTIQAPSMCVGEHGEYNNVAGKVCPMWTTVIQDWMHLPVGLAAHMKQILLSDVEGKAQGFGNYWNNPKWTTSGFLGANQGQPVTLNQYRKWLTAFGLGPSQPYYLGFLPVQGNDLSITHTFPAVNTGSVHIQAQSVTLNAPSHWYEGVPIVQFDHPDKRSGRYGIWLALESIDGGFDSPLVLRVVVASLAYAQSLLPQESLFGRIINDLNPFNWPGMFVDLLEDIGHAIVSLASALVDEAGNLLCDLASNPTLVTAAITAAAAAQGVPPKSAVGAASQISSMAAQQCATKPPDCTNPANATLTQCKALLPPVSATGPWYTQWYVIVPAIAAVGYLLIKPKS